MVYVVQAGKAVQRPVQVIFAQGDDAAVTGVKAGESIVLDGKQNVRPDTPVVERASARRPALPSGAQREQRHEFF